LAGLHLTTADPTARDALRLTPDSRVLLFGTEGVTDPVVYENILRSRRI
jgi:diaminopropionate ammonia-lyase